MASVKPVDAPEKPKLNDVFTDTNGRTYSWNGTAGWKQVKTDEEWVKIANTKMGAYAYLLKPNPEFKGISKIMRQAIKEEWYKDPTVLNANMENALLANPYYANAGRSALQFDVDRPGEQTRKIDNVKIELDTIPGANALPTEAYEKLARDAARKGFTGRALGRFANTEILKQQNPGQYSYTDASKKALQSAPADDLRNLAKSYQTMLGSGDEQSLLSGKKTLEDFKQSFQEKAKMQNPHLATQIDMGFSLDDISADYKKYASQVLDKPESEIDMSPTGKYNAALRVSDGKDGFRQMGMAEWVNTLRTDEKYGWQFTKEANDQVRQLGMNLAKTFGKIR